MAKYQQYAEYKDTQDSWLSLIPNKWEVVPLKFLCLNPVKDGPHETPVFIDDGIPFLSVDGIQNNQLVFNGCRYISEKDHEKYSRKCAPVHGDILLGKAASVGKVAYVDTSIEFNVWSPLAVITPKDARLGKYIFYAFQSTMLQAQCEVYSNSNTQKNLGMNTIDNLHLPCPSYKEAEKIANFLDHETAQIDTLIEKQQTLIQLLKEKRQAVISHAVTKGLNPDAPMKDSGVEWLGEVPEHWEVVQAKYIADITRGAILRPVDAPEYFDENGEWSYLNISDATKCDKYLYESKLRLSPLGSKKSARVYPNNLIITASATIGKAFINKVKVCVHDGFIPFCNIKVDINYLYHYVSNPYLYAAMGKSNTQKNIYLDEVKNMIVTVPSREEQEKIVEHIEKNQNEYSKLIDKAQQQIQLMQERRTALISAAVTGKIDVRGWTAPDIEVGA